MFHLRMLQLKPVHALPQLEGCPYVFYNLKSKDRWCDCRKPWEEAGEKAGLPEMQVKDLRRHYAINLAERRCGHARHPVRLRPCKRNHHRKALRTLFTATCGKEDSESAGGWQGWSGNKTETSRPD